MEVAQSCPTLSDPMDYSPPGSSIHGIFQARVLEWGAIAFSDREAIESQIGPTSICDPAVSPYFHVYLVFLHKHFPLWIPPSGPLGLSPHSQQQILPKDCSPISMPQLPVTALSRGLASLSRVHRAVAKFVCMVLIPFRLSQISCCTLQRPQILLHSSKQLPWCGHLTCASVPQTPMCRSSPSHCPLFPFIPSSYRVFHGLIYSFLVVRDSCPLSASVMRDLLCLKVYFWCIFEERWTQQPPTPLPSCPLWIQYFKIYQSLICDP